MSFDSRPRGDRTLIRCRLVAGSPFSRARAGPVCVGRRAARAGERRRDLVTTALRLALTRPCPGDTLTVSVTARNAGDTPATAAYIGLVMLDDVTLGEGAECVNFLGAPGRLQRRDARRPGRP